MSKLHATAKDENVQRKQILRALAQKATQRLSPGTRSAMFACTQEILLSFWGGFVYKSLPVKLYFRIVPFKKHKQDGVDALPQPGTCSWCPPPRHASA